MAIRYVAPSMFQPSEREMRQRAARQDNVFRAGRNLSSAFLRQNAIDNAMYKQAQERLSRQREQDARKSLQQQEAARQQRMQLDRAAAARRQADETVVDALPFFQAAQAQGLKDRAGSNFSDIAITPMVDDFLANPENMAGPVMPGAIGAPVMVGDQMAGQRFSGETNDRLARERDARARAAGLLDGPATGASAARVNAILSTLASTLGPDHPNVRAAVAEATRAQRESEARDRDFAEFLPGPFTVGSYDEMDVSVPAGVRARPNILADEVLTPTPASEQVTEIFGDEEPISGEFAMKVLSQLPAHLSVEDKIMYLDMALRRQQERAGKGR